MKHGFTSVLLALVFVACNEEPAKEPAMADPAAWATALPRIEDLPWPGDDALYDVDCRVLPGIDAGKDAHKDACAVADLAGHEKEVDELHRRYMWKLFMRLVEEGKVQGRQDDKAGTRLITYAVVPGQRWDGTGLAAQGLDEVGILKGTGLDAIAHEASRETCKDHDPKLVNGFLAPGWDAESSSGHPSPPMVNPLWDQNGNQVKIEVLLLRRDDPKRVRTAQEQVTNMCTGATRSTQWGSLAQEGNHGPVHLKLAWRKIASQEDCDYGFIIKGGKPCAKGEHGLVAIHIVAKLLTQDDFWLWGTFSHVNNVEEQNGLPPLFRAPACSDCEDNKCPDPADGKPRRTQVRRVTPIPNEVHETKRVGENKKVITGVYRRYDLLGVQRLPGIARGGSAIPVPRPATLANEIIEWDRQDSSCIGCHSWARVASFADHENACEKLCEVKSPGPRGPYAVRECVACPHSESRFQVCPEGGCGGACEPVARRMRFGRDSSGQLYPLADMAWFYDHCWFNRNSKECQ